MRWYRWENVDTRTSVSKSQDAVSLTEYGTVLVGQCYHDCCISGSQEAVSFDKVRWYRGGGGRRGRGVDTRTALSGSHEAVRLTEYGIVLVGQCYQDCCISGSQEAVSFDRVWDSIGGTMASGLLYLSHRKLRV